MTIYKTLSKGEAQLLNGLPGIHVFTFPEAEAVAGKGASKVLFRLKEKGWITEIERGRYALLGLKGPESMDALEIAASIITPSYISFWSALRFYDLTEQLPRQVFVASARSKPPISLGTFSIRFVCMPPQRLFGYEKALSGGKEIMIADKEKAIIDSLYLPQYAGGMGEARQALMEGEFDAGRLTSYALRMGSKSLLSRLGYIFDEKGIDLFPGLGAHLGKGYIKLDPSGGAKGRTSSKWRIIDNDLQGD